MHTILVGIETEYGLFVEGKGADEQVEEAVAFVRSYEGPGFRGWDYKYENPRKDLRGFEVDRLQTDPRDAAFERPTSLTDQDIRSDWVLPNGARFYNDHGHPEYSTPECWSSWELALNDLAGEAFLLKVRDAFQAKTGRRAILYKNNTDFHGASYGTHESYLLPRSVPYGVLFQVVAPMLVARTLLCGAGKVGSEAGARADFQLSQRADFLTEKENVETLYRRPLFNTRDEPHADPQKWVRLHVISGDANRIAGCTARKVALVQIALAMACEGVLPVGLLKNPARALSQVSRDADAKLEFEDGSMKTAEDILLRYLDVARNSGLLRGDWADCANDCERLLRARAADPDTFASEVDWAAKKRMIEQFRESEGLSWSDQRLRALDLEYSNIDPGESLFEALVDAGTVKPQPSIGNRLEQPNEPTRAFARSIAVSRFSARLTKACWRSVTFGAKETYLDPSSRYSRDLAAAVSVESFIEAIENDQG